ncbi:nucleotide-diphospho-sugar transferase [Cadophora sp. MPI-SDFR-AT-0126]|nr:nucleotide-diphospho-sugar transferase [Leotiomycetes sp. MPI-SDFR-AT-0126]
MDRRDVYYEEEMKDIRGHNQPYLNAHYDPHAISTDNLMMPERLAATPSPRGRMRPGYPGAHDSVGSGHGWHPDSIPGTPADSRCTTPTLSPYNHDFSGSRSYLSTTTLVNKGPNSGHLSTSTFPSKHSLVSQDSITQLNKRDDVELSKGWRRFIFKFVPFLALANTGLYLAYLGLRIACVILAQKKFNVIYPGAWVFLGVEIVVAIPSQMHNFWTMWALKKRNRPQLRLLSDEVPGVDVFVTCCGEDDDVVLDTVRAACDLDYPRDRFRVVVLDDGKSATLEASVTQLGYVYSNLYYMARTKVKGVPHHFKAGNLNYGLEQLDLLPGGANEFMAALDADMIPEPSWLRAIMPHMVIDPKLALACPPQLFYNTPKSDPLAQSLNFFVHVIEPIKDALGVAWCTGSGYVIRRQALTEIGNFPLGSLAEDVATSTLMLGCGWKTAYIHEPLQFGTVPEDYGGHLKQRTRWAIGTIQTAFKLNFCLWGKDVKMMSGAQRFSGALYAILGMFTILVTISLFAIPVVLVWGKPLIAYADMEQLRWLIRACFAAFMCNRLCEFALFSPAGYHTGQRDSRYQLWMSPYISLSIIRSFILPKWLGGSVVAFKPTGSLGNALNERDPKNKKNMLRRLWAILFNYMAIFHFVFVYFTLVAVVLTSYRVFFPEGQSVRNIFIGLITHAFWPPLTFLFLCSSLWTPVSYAIDPPMVPERDELLVRDQKTGVAHPTTESKKVAFGGQAAWFEFLYTGSTIYTALVFAYSFWL